MLVCTEHNHTVNAPGLNQVEGLGTVGDRILGEDFERGNLA